MVRHKQLLTGNNLTNQRIGVCKLIPLIAILKLYMDIDRYLTDIKDMPNHPSVSQNIFVNFTQKQKTWWKNAVIL